MGFVVPLRNWLCGGMREWAEDLLELSRLRQDGILDAVIVRNKWLEHRQGLRNWEYQLWNILMFQSWYQYQKRVRGAPL